MKMTISLTLLLSLSLAIHTATAFNITKMLENYPDYSQFNSYLTQTNLASEINSRSTITVLAVDNGNISPLSGKALPLLKNILSVHVVLDYYDMAKIHQLSKTSVLLTTLFQASGVAQNHQGFINCTILGSDSVAMGSAAPGSPLGTNLVKSIVAQPYNISVLQVSNVIVPPGIDGTGSTAAAPTSTPPTPPAAPKSSPSPPPTAAPKSSPPAPPTPAPKSSKAKPPAKSVTPAKAPASDADEDSDSPSADAPAVDDAPAADEAKSGAPALHVGLAAVVTMVFSSLCLASRI